MSAYQRRDLNLMASGSRRWRYDAEPDFQRVTHGKSDGKTEEASIDLLF
jgi:hypothetical protein